MTRGTVLVVDDDPTISALLREMLADEGYRVLVATNVADALEILKSIRVGLIVTDAFLAAIDPMDDPWHPLAPLVAAANDTPLVLCSAHAPRAYTDYVAHGFVASLPKPFDLDDLLTLVASLTLGSEMSPPAVETALAQQCAPRERGRHYR